MGTFREWFNLKKSWMYIIPALGLLLTVIMVITGAHTTAPAEPVVEPARPGFKTYVSGNGIIEAPWRNIAVGTPLAGVVMQIYVQRGDEVKVGDLLFRIDSRDVDALLNRQMRDLDIAERQVVEAEQDYEDKKILYERASKVSNTGAVSAEEIIHREFTMKIAQSRMATAQANVRSLLAQMEQTRTQLERLNVRAPVDGQVLQVNIRVGEYAPANQLNDTNVLMLLGATNPLHVRVSIDESDAWRFDPKGEAVAFLRGNPSIKIPLTYAYTEPFVLPKQSLTGDTTERVDTRVLQVVYKFNRDHYPVYVGQQVDVYISSPYGYGDKYVEKG